MTEDEARRLIERAFKDADRVEHRGGQRAQRPLVRGDAVTHLGTGREGIYLGPIGYHSAVVRFVLHGGEVEKKVIPIRRLGRIIS